MDFYFDCYSELSLQRYMVSDQPRTDAFAAAIQEVVNDGDHVLDLGTGTGLLAMLSAKSGAEKVYAVDQAGVAEAAKQIIERNHLSDTIEVIHSNATNFQLAEPVDIMVSEWLGLFCFAENMLDDVIVCRDENLKKGGTMLPSGVELLIAPVDSSLLYDIEGPGYWKNDVHGIDFSHLETVELKQALATKTIIPNNDLMADGKPIIALNLETATAEDPWQSGEVEFIAERDGKLNGFAGWFVAQLSPSVKLDTGPNQPRTHWEQIYFSMAATPLKKGQVIKVRYRLSPHPVEPRSLSFKLSVNDLEFDYTVG